MNEQRRKKGRKRERELFLIVEYQLTNVEGIIIELEKSPFGSHHRNNCFSHIQWDVSVRENHGLLFHVLLCCLSHSVHVPMHHLYN